MFLIWIHRGYENETLTGSWFQTSAARGNRDSELGYWTQFVRAFFSQKGVLRHSVHVYGEGGTDKQYEITFPALARYFHTHFDSGVRNMQLIMEKGTMDKPLPDGGHYVENPRSSIVYWFDNGSHVSGASCPGRGLCARCADWSKNSWSPPELLGSCSMPSRG